MSASIDDVLSFRAPNGSPTSVLPPQLAMLLLDTLQAPADFLFVHLLSRAFKQGRHCCLVGVNRDKEYYNTVLKKHVRSRVVGQAAALCYLAHICRFFRAFSFKRT